MITTIVHGKLRLDEICQAQLHFLEIADKIEYKLKLPPEHQITLSISGIQLPRRLRTQHYIAGAYTPKYEIFLVAPCEIVSFEQTATMATRIIGAYDHFFVWARSKNSFYLDDTPVMVTPEEIVRKVLTFFKKKK